MSTPVSPTFSTRSRRWSDHDTGFPEPFCGDRNTTRPHPSAAFGVTITDEDICGDRAVTLRRSRNNSLLSQHRRTTSSGFINPRTGRAEPVQNIASLALLETPVEEKQADDLRIISPSMSSSRESKDAESMSSKKDGEMTPPSSPGGSHKRRSLLFWRR